MTSGAMAARPPLPDKMYWPKNLADNPYLMGVILVNLHMDKEKQDMDFTRRVWCRQFFNKIYRQDPSAKRLEGLRTFMRFNDILIKKVIEELARQDLKGRRKSEILINVPGNSASETSKNSVENAEAENQASEGFRGRDAQVRKTRYESKTKTLKIQLERLNIQAMKKKIVLLHQKVAVVEEKKVKPPTEKKTAKEIIQIDISSDTE